MTKQILKKEPIWTFGMQNTTQTETQRHLGDWTELNRKLLNFRKDVINC